MLFLPPIPSLILPPVGIVRAQDPDTGVWGLLRSQFGLRRNIDGAGNCCCDHNCPCCTSLPTQVRVQVNNVENWDGDYTLTRGDMAVFTCPGANDPCTWYVEEGCGNFPLITFGITCTDPPAGTGTLIYTVHLVEDCVLGLPEHIWIRVTALTPQQNCTNLISAGLTFGAADFDGPPTPTDCTASPEDGEIIVSLL